MPKRIFAILVGIVAYNEHLTLDDGAVIFPKLEGCVMDAHKMKLFLTENYIPENLSVIEFYDEDATKSNICQAFLKHFGEAQENDSLLFYFSGHGTQEYADTCFSSESDKKLESLVCYFDKTNKDNCLLADKELRFLINKATKCGAHTTIVIDSCHSGDITRNVKLLRDNYSDPIEKKSKGTYTFSKRPWNHFIFSDQFSADDIKVQGISALLPEGNHIVFSASQSHQPAFEVAGEGIFTRHLIDKLHSFKGQISNRVLFDILTSYMNSAYKQRPQLYVPKNAKYLVESGFLNASFSKDHSQCSVLFNPKLGWILNRGQIDGLHVDIETIDVFVQHNPKLKFNARFKAIYLDYSLLDINDEVSLDEVLGADLNFSGQCVVKIYLSIDTAVTRDAAKILDLLSALPKSQALIVDTEEFADVVLIHNFGKFYLTKPFDWYQPISKVVPYSHIDQLIEQIVHLSAWMFIVQLKNSDNNPRISDYLDIDYSFDGVKYLPLFLKNNSDNIEIINWNDTDVNPSKNLYVKLKNKAANDLHLAVLYLDLNYSSDTILLEPSPYHLDAGEIVELNINGDVIIPLEFDTMATYYNLQQYTERLKIIVSSTQFELHRLLLDPMLDPPLPGVRRDLDPNDSIRRSGSIVRKRSLEGWIFADIKMTSVNPSYNRIQIDALTEMLTDKLTSFFARKKFFTMDATDIASLFSNKLAVSKDVTLFDQEREVNGSEKINVLNTANFSNIEEWNNYYADNIRRFPERERIVIAGDSWILNLNQYELLTSLSKLYAIRYVVSGGSSLKSYFSDINSNGEYFLDVVRIENPDMLIISGGGEDLFGMQFGDFLADHTSWIISDFKGEVSHLLTPSFYFQLQKLMSIYETILTLLINEFPKIKILVHGYRYEFERYLDIERLSDVFAEKKISNQSDREALFKLIIEKFNDALIQVVTQYSDRVRHVDLRTTSFEDI